MPAGRPEIPIDFDEVERLAGLGNTEAEIALALGVCADTIASRKKKYSEFAERIKRGRQRAINKVENALFTTATGGNTTAQIFFLCNRAPDKWKRDRDKASAESNTVTINLEGVQPAPAPADGHDD